MEFVEVKPRKLSDVERKFLLLALKPKPPDDRFSEFVNMFEVALARYVILRERFPYKATASEVRSACEEIEYSALKLRGAWNKAPIEALQRFDLAYQAQRYEDQSPTGNINETYVRSHTSVFSEDTSPFFEGLEQTLDMLVKTARLAVTPSEKQKKGGRPLNAPKIVLARDIAGGFVDILNTRPTKTPTGAFSEVLYLALQLVHGVSKPISVSRYVRRAVDEIPKTSSRSGRKLPKPGK